MSDLTATNCGCNNGCNNNNGLMGGSCIWIILLLVFCGGCGNGMGGILGGNSGCGCDNDNNGCCDILILILLLSCFCGNNKGCC